jgi:WASH complex subunit CCDC53
MDADGLPLVGPGINLAQIEPINQKRMLAFLNHFLSHTVAFLNRFSVVCEEKLENLTIRIQRLESTLSILEAKLSSIPGLDDVTATAVHVTQPSTATSVSQALVVTMATVATTSTAAATTLAEPVTIVPAVNGGVLTEATPADLPTNRAANDPRYAKYFRLLSMKIPKEALQQRMAIEGLDPTVLDNPNAVVEPPTAAATAPPREQQQKQQRDSDNDDFSDNDNRQRSSSLSSASSSSTGGDSDFS